MTKEDAGILVVDDEFSVRDSLCSWFRKGGYRVGAAENAAEALRRLQEGVWDLVLLDIKMPGMDGLELQQRIRQINPHITVIIITAYASVETAVQALKEGAFDYVTKPIDPDQLDYLVRNAVEQHRLKTENLRLREKIEGLAKLDEIIGESPEMARVRKLASSVAQTDAAVVIRGAGGTGKELVARTIHAHSERRYFSIVPVNCETRPESVLASELLGHESGAQGGALYRRKGRLEMADGGTLFLDEVGRLGTSTQEALLRILETKEFKRLGGAKPIRVDIRVICATKQDLEMLVREGAFREDLYYRINVVTIDLPPLRARRSDIPLLARHFVEKYALQTNKNIADIDPEAMDVLTRYDWPGNVRELANAIERAIVVGKDVAIRREDLPVRFSSAVHAAAGNSLADLEKTHIARVLEEAGWDVYQAAEILGIDRAALDGKIEKYGLRK